MASVRLGGSNTGGHGHAPLAYWLASCAIPQKMPSYAGVHSGPYQGVMVVCTNAVMAYPSVEVIGPVRDVRNSL